MRSQHFPRTSPPRPVRLPFKLARKPPGTVRLGFWILIVASALQATVFIWTLVTFDMDTYIADNIGALERDGQEIVVSPTLATGTFLFGALAGAAFIAARIAFTLLMARGLNWARIVVSALFGLILLPPYDWTADSVVTTVLAGAGIVALWLPTSNSFFRVVKAERRAHKTKLLF